LEQVAVVVQHAGAERLKPIYDALHGRVGYERIRIAVACLANQAAERTGAGPHFKPGDRPKMASMAPN
jgi:hypothetical protein